MRAPAAICAFLAIGTLARADMTQLPQMVMDALGSIDRAPSASDLDTALNTVGQQTALRLAAIAVDPNVDVGVALRSIRALSQYPQSAIGSTIAHDTLASIIASHQTATTTVDVLVLRAAIESLGLLRVAADVDTLAPTTGGPSPLDHPSRDVRVAVARALRDLGNPAAIPRLRQRYGQEMVPQVRLAISDALTALGGT
jgi:HEAT repeat protein